MPRGEGRSAGGEDSSQKLQINKSANLQEATMTLTELERRNPKRRDKLVIMTEIIGVAVKGASKTQIMYKANLSFSSLKRYLTLLSRHSLLKESGSAGREIYKATPKGIEFMEIQLHLINYINERPKKSNKTYPLKTRASSWPSFSNKYRNAYSRTYLSHLNTK